MAGLSTPALAPGTGGGGGSSTITSLLGLTAAGQQTMAASLPVVIASNQSTLPVSLSGNQAVNVAQLAGTATSVNNGATDAGTLRVTLASDSTGQVKLAAGANTIGALTANQSVNVSQINAVTPLMGNGTTGTGSQRVTIASDNTAFSVNATLSAETSKVIGTVNQGTSPWIINTGSATGSAVPANGFFLGGQSASGNLIGARMGGADGLTLGFVLATMNMITNGTNADQVRSATASSGTSGTGVMAAGEMVLAKTSLPTAVTDAQNVQALGDKFGRRVVINNGMRDIILPMTQLTLAATTTETSLIAAVASTFLDLLSIVVINTSATATQVDFRDSTAGTIRLSLYVPAGDTRGIVFNTPLPQAAVNTAWTAKCGTSVSSVIITGTYITNK